MGTAPLLLALCQDYKEEGTATVSSEVQAWESVLPVPFLYYVIRYYMIITEVGLLVSIFYYLQLLWVCFELPHILLATFIPNSYFQAFVSFEHVKG